MKTFARIENVPNEHNVLLPTNDREHWLTIPPKPEGLQSVAAPDLMLGDPAKLRHAAARPSASRG